MTLHALALAALMAHCAPAVAPSTMTAIVQVESGGNPLAIGDNTAGRSYYPHDRGAAERLARRLLNAGHLLDLGIAQIDSMNLVGFGANVNEHLNKVFTSALLLSIIGAGAQLSQPQQPAGLYAAPSVGQTIAGAFGQQIGNTSIQLTQRQLEIPPTLEVPPGYLFNVLVDRDIVLMAPYADGGPR